MRVVVTGAHGQLGRQLLEVLAPRHQVLGFDRQKVNITDYAATVAAVGAARPDLVIHTAAMTDVEGCERDPDGAFAVNALGTQNVALACREIGAALVYISTNMVFDGSKKSPYLEFDRPKPISVYGQSKLAGEEYVRSLVPEHFIVRTSWIYGAHGAKFMQRILALAAQGKELWVVTDETGSPTYAKDLAEAVAALCERPVYGVYHLVNDGGCSRYDWAVEALALAETQDTVVRPTTLADFRRLAAPPKNGVLRNFCASTALGIRLRPWQEGLLAYFADTRGSV